jgi:hypothetical protein
MKLSQFRRIIKEEVKKVLQESKHSKRRSRLNESSSKVRSAIQKNKAALMQALRKRLRNEEDMNAYDAVEKLIIQTAVDAGMDKRDAENTSWMEAYAIPGEMTAQENMEMLEGELSEREADGWPKD